MARVLEYEEKLGKLLFQNLLKVQQKKEGFC